MKLQHVTLSLHIYAYTKYSCNNCNFGLIIFLFCSNNSASGKKRIKQVHLHKHDADELGMAILGGLEHGLPIIISEVFPNSAVGRCKKIYAGEDFFLNSVGLGLEAENF